MTVSIASGYDPGYLTRAVATGRENYYLSAVSEQGEPPGYWSGRGGEALGLAKDSEVRAEVMEPLYREFTNPAGERLGSRPSTYEALRDRVAAKVTAQLAAEPGATAERRAEIVNQAMRETRTSVYFFDLTYSVPKSVSLLHAGLQVRAEQARAGGQDAAAAEWDRLADTVWAGIKAGNQAMLDYAQDEAGYTRTGHHSATSGEWRDAHAWTVASFPQHTSREGDPQLHVHNAALNRVQRSDGEDARWRTLDGAALYRVRPALGAVAERVTAEYLAGELGVQIVPRGDGNGWEIGGVDQDLMDRFSSRRAAITPGLDDLVEEYTAKHGHAPSRRALYSMAQFVTLATRPGKAHTAPSRGEMLAAWEAQSRGTETQALSEVPGATLGRGGGPGRRPDPEERARIIAAAVADTQSRKAAWTRYDLLRSLDRELPPHLGGLTGPEVRELLDGLADEAITHVTQLTAPDLVPVPEAYQRAAGESLFRPHGAEQYAARDQLDLEERILARAAATGAACVDPDRAAAALGGERARIEAALWDSRGGTDSAGITGGGGDTPLSAIGLSDDQAMAAYGILTSGRACEVLVGPAGTGKTHTVAAIARIWAAETGHRVVGLTASQNAAEVMRGEGLAEAYNIADWIGQIEGSADTRGHLPIYEGDILVLDEASMISSSRVDELQGIAARRGARLLLTGDTEQHSSPEAGGAMRLLAAEHGHYQLRTVRRFTAAWESEASLRLRAGDPDVLAEYDRHGRIREGTAEDMADTAVRHWLADHLADRETLLLTTSNARALDLSLRAREQLVGLGLVANRTDVLLGGDKAPASTGDLIRARENAPEIRTGDGRTLTNRAMLIIDGWTGTGGQRRAIVRRMGDRAETGQPPTWSEPFTIPAAYLENHAELAYAGNTHVAEGRTVDTAHLVIGDEASREAVYVALSRGRDRNTAYVATDAQRAADKQLQDLGRFRRPQGADEPTRGNRFGVLADALERADGNWTATETVRAELDRAASIATLAPLWRTVTRDAAAARYDAVARQLLSGEDYARYRADPERDALTRALRGAELAGQDAEAVLRQAAEGRGMKGARSVAAVLHGRVTRLTGNPQPRAATWTERTPAISDPKAAELARGLAAALDDRARVLGERAAADPPAWALRYLGEPPADPLGRTAWATRAGWVAAEREEATYSDPAEAIGPDHTSPEQRATWITAYTALGAPEAEQEVRGATDGQLWLTRAAYDRTAGWAPPWVGDELRAARLAETDSRTDAHLAWAAADRATGPDAERARQLAASYTTLAQEVADRRQHLAEIDEARRVWHAATERDRQRATAADAELRRRHPGADLGPLQAADGPAAKAEPGAATDAQAVRRGPAAEQLTLDGRAHRVQDIPRATAEPEHEESARREQVAGQAAFDFGYVPEADVDEGLRARLEAARAGAGERQALQDRQAAADADEADRHQSAYWQAIADQRREATWQPGRGPGAETESAEYEAEAE